jgi:DNA-directed RNA polymerase subunit RPC12/RpoP
MVTICIPTNHQSINTLSFLFLRLIISEEVETGVVNPVDIKLEENPGEAVYDETNSVDFMELTSNRKSLCAQCGAEVLHLKHHNKEVHNKKPESEVLLCPDCGKKRINKNQLTLHRRYIHKVVDNLFCNLCAKPCPNKAKLRQHTLTCIARIKRLKENADEAHRASL